MSGVPGVRGLGSALVAGQWGSAVCAQTARVDSEGRTEGSGSSPADRLFQAKRRLRPLTPSFLCLAHPHHRPTRPPGRGQGLRAPSPDTGRVAPPELRRWKSWAPVTETGGAAAPVHTCA